jgi:hypothetical protein
MEESYIEGRFGIVMEEIRDALIGIEAHLQKISESMDELRGCVEDRTKLKMIRVADMTRKP